MKILNRRYLRQGEIVSAMSMIIAVVALGASVLPLTDVQKSSLYWPCLMAAALLMARSMFCFRMSVTDDHPRWAKLSLPGRVTRVKVRMLAEPDRADTYRAYRRFRDIPWDSPMPIEAVAVNAFSPGDVIILGDLMFSFEEAAENHAFMRGLRR